MSYAVRTPRIVRPESAARAVVAIAVDAKLADEANRRWAHRRPSASTATLQSTELGDPVPCMVLDTSSTGARVKPHFTRAARCQSILDLPDTFTLVYAMDRVAIDCKVAWRRNGELGLRYSAPARMLPKPVAPRLKSTAR